MTKNNQQFREFLRDEVNINQSRIDRLTSGVKGVNGCLKNNLKGYQNMERQGSYALGTLIKPVDNNNEYDADIQIVMNPNDDWDPKDYVDAIHRTLKQNQTYADKLRLKTRCVTIDYAGYFHLDVVPRVTINGKHYICNRRDNKFEPTDGTGYRDWFNEKNRITGGNLKRAVRLLKYLRDHKGNYTAKSILLTTLAGNAIEPSDEGKEAVGTVSDTLVTILTRMDEYLQRHPTMPEIENPVLSTETFNRHWDQTKYANFRRRVHSHAHTASEAFNAESTDEALKNWRKLLGDDFGKGSSGGGNGGGGDSKPKPPGGPSGNRSTAVFAPPVRPRPQYAGSLATESREVETKSIRISDRDLRWISEVQPGLSYNPESNLISGKLVFAEMYDLDDGLLKSVSSHLEDDNRMGIRDRFDVLIRLTFMPTPFNPWPTVIETGKRIQKIMEEQGIANIADMHCYSDCAENRCCLGFQVETGEPFRLPEFIRELVIPFFYRVAYVDRYGLEASKHDLWKTYPHQIEDTKNAYFGDLRAMVKTRRNQRCPCGSGLKHKRCHFDEVRAAKLGGML